MNEFKTGLKDKPGSPLLLAIYCYLAGIEFAYTFLSYIVFYNKYNWWENPTTTGKILLIGLSLVALVFGFLGRYYFLHPDKAIGLANYLNKKKIQYILLIFLMLGFIASLLVIINPPILPAITGQLLHKHPRLVYLAILIIAQTIGAVIFLRIQYFDEMLLPIYLELKKSPQKNKNVHYSLRDILLIAQKKWMHILIWLMMIFYFFTGSSLYTHFILANGKPVEFAQGLPLTTDQIKYGVDSLNSIKVNGQDLYKLSGWSFYLNDPDQDKYTRYVVIQSNSKTYFFTTQSQDRVDVQRAFNNLNLNLRNSGYSTIISKDVIRPGRYQIGILFEDNSQNAVYYIITNKILVRTPNYLRLGTIQ
jgi:hypothetical protein